MRQQPRTKAALYLAVVFLAGAAFGGAAHRFYAARVAEADSRPLTAAEWRQQYINELQQELGLSADQAADMQTILVENGQHWCDFWAVAGPELDAVRRQGSERIKLILSAEQQQKYQVILDEREKRREEKKLAACP